MNCAIYTRVSTDNQVEKEYNSLETQKESLLAYVQAHKYEGWKVVDFYEEAGESASTLNRPELQRLIYDIRNKRVNAVIVYKIDRLTRNQKDFYSLIELFEKYNVTFIATTQNFDTSSAAGRLMRNIMLDFAQFEREMTAERTKDKMEARAKKGFWNGGLVPLGYDYSPEKKRLKINPEEAEIINLVFNTYLNEKSISKVTRNINSKGFRSKFHPTKTNKIIGGKEFIITNTSYILTNPIYVGLIKHNKNTYQGQHESIVDKDVFDKVQEILGKNRKTFTCPHQNKYNFLLQGLVKCGECGSVMSSHYSVNPVRELRPLTVSADSGFKSPSAYKKGIPPTSSMAFSNGVKRGKKYFYYKCTKIMHRDKQACPSKPLSAREFENAVITKINDLSQDRNQLKETLNNANLVAQKELIPLREKKAILEKSRDEKDREINRLIKAIKSGSLEIESIERELRLLEKDKKSLEGQIENLDIFIRREENKLIDIDIVQRTYQGFGQFYPNLQPKEQHQFLQLLIKDMNVYSDRVKVSFYEVPEMALNIEGPQKHDGLCEPSKWLPISFKFKFYSDFFAEYNSFLPEERFKEINSTF